MKHQKCSFPRPRRFLFALRVNSNWFSRSQSQVVLSLLHCPVGSGSAGERKSYIPVSAFQMATKVKSNGGGVGVGVTTTTELKDDTSVGGGHDSRRSGNGEREANGGRVKYRRTRSVGRAEEITKEENKQRRSQPDKPWVFLVNALDSVIRMLTFNQSSVRRRYQWKVWSVRVEWSHR